MWLNVEQHPLPTNSHPNARVENCGDADSPPTDPNNFPLDDADPVVDIYCGILTGSYDPNDKTGFPKGQTENNYISANQQLQYWPIRFQNTGTDTAFTVVIRDTLDVDFDILCFWRIKLYEFKIMDRGFGWTFNDINLPDSAANQEGSNVL